MGKSLLLLPIGMADYGIVIPQSETLTFPLEFYFRNLDGLYPEGSPLFPGDPVLEIPALEPSFPQGAATPSLSHGGVEAVSSSDRECETTSRSKA